jgi:hypothetical protein
LVCLEHFAGTMAVHSVEQLPPLFLFLPPPPFAQISEEFFSALAAANTTVLQSPPGHE